MKNEKEMKRINFYFLSSPWTFLEDFVQWFSSIKNCSVLRHEYKYQDFLEVNLFFSLLRMEIIEAWIQIWRNRSDTICSSSSLKVSRKLVFSNLFETWKWREAESLLHLLNDLCTNHEVWIKFLWSLHYSSFLRTKYQHRHYRTVSSSDLLQLS